MNNHALPQLLLILELRHSGVCETNCIGILLLFCPAFLPLSNSHLCLYYAYHLRQCILLATKEEFIKYLGNLEQDEDFLEELDELESNIQVHGDSSSSSSSSTSSSSSSSSESSSSSSDASMAFQQCGSSASPDLDEHELHLQNISQYTALLDQILSSRILDTDTKPIPKLSQLHLVLVDYREDNPRGFRRNLRVSPPTFDSLVEYIKDHTVFHNRSNVQQFPVEVQLAIALFRFGHDGNAVSVESVAQWAGVSAGMVVKSTRRVMIAFLSIHDAVVRWPTDDEKEEAKEWVGDTSCPAWRNGF